MHLILLGPAGSGKGTLARMLVERQAYGLFETGVHLRAIAEEPTELGRRLQAELAKGNMAPTWMVMDALERALEESPDQRFILDGIPRNPEQASEFLSRVQAGSITPDRVVVLDAPRATLFSRLMARRDCRDCGALHNLANGPSPKDGHCYCGSPLQARNDDHPEAIRRRFDLYDQLTTRAIEMLAQAGIPVHQLDASREPEATYQDVIAIQSPQMGIRP